MNSKELIDAVAAETGLDAKTVKRVNEATFASIAASLSSEGKAKLGALGVFVKKEGKEPGKSRIIFRPHDPSKPKKTKSSADKM